MLIGAIPIGTTLLAAALTSVVATLAEAVSPTGADNLSVPLLAAATLYLFVA